MSLLRGVSEGRMTRLQVPKRGPLRAELEAFLSAAVGREQKGPTNGQGVSTEAEGVVTGEDGLAVLGLALELVRSG